jgi:hypothetical protein
MASGTGNAIADVGCSSEEQYKRMAESDQLLRVSPGGANPGAMDPRLMMYLIPSATDISSFVTLSSGTSMRKPDVGFGVVGTKTQTSLVFNRARSEERRVGKECTG